MSYISMNVSEETKKRVETKLAELQDSMITDELIEEVFMQERKGIIRQAINEEMQRKGFKQIFASAIDNIINRQLHTAEEFLQKANVTSAECDIQRGQVWCNEGAKVLVMKTTPNTVHAVAYDYVATKSTTKVYLLTDFIKQFSRTDTNILQQTKFWVKADGTSVILVKPKDTRLAEFTDTGMTGEEFEAFSEKAINHAREILIEKECGLEKADESERVYWDTIETRVLIREYTPSITIA